MASRKVIRYACGTCDKEFDAQEEADRHETEGHHSATQIVEAKYSPFDGESPSYPTSLVIEFDNGEKLTYERKHEPFLPQGFRRKG
jgi:hypothetical protein